MLKLIKWIPIAIAWLPHVLKAVSLFEIVLAPGTPGSEKKAAVLAWLSETAKKLGLPWGDSAIGVVSDLIDTVVGILNFVGQFTHRSQGAPVASPEAAQALSESIEAAKAADPELERFLARLSR